MCLLVSVTVVGQSFSGNKTVTYAEAIAIYKGFADDFEEAELIEFGMTDAGYPLHVLMIDREARVSRHNKVVMLVNNGIHPGEPCGIDASIQLARRVLEGSHGFEGLLDSVRIAIVPVYNIGGALQRGCCVRANQDGPEEYGFRGNARNLDLNRDFIKADSRNAQAFYRVFHHVKPNVIIDTHTSNGADYSYVMTMLNTQPDKAGALIGNYMRETMNGALYAAMEEREYPMIPYVLSRGKVPETGLLDYLESPRYTTGYAALFNVIGYTTEAHMLKPYAHRVESTYRFIAATLNYMHAHRSELMVLKHTSDRQVVDQKHFALDWELDTTHYRMIPFRGYEAEYPVSKVTGERRLFYNRAKPYTKDIKYYDTYQVTKSVEAPVAYVIPFAWHEVIERFELNNVEMEVINEDREAEVECYYIQAFTSASKPYEGRHMKTATELERVVERVVLRRGDRLVRVNQPANRYIVETLEPEGIDAFFRWGFFDSVLQQKEWYSDYVFEDLAHALLENDAQLKQSFEAAKATDPELAASAQKQLYWIYRRSPHYEGSVNRYPILRLHELPKSSNP